MNVSSIKKEEILFVFAIKREAHASFSGFNCVFTGVGKLNACYKLMKGLQQWQKEKGGLPKLVLNLGSAGSARFKTGDIVNCLHFYQRDMDVTALGGPAYATPFEGSDAPLSRGISLPGYPEGICGSGDQFVVKSKETPWDVIDMEAFALAKTCMKEDILFACLKYITDGADSRAAQDWERTLEESAEALYEAVKNSFVA